MAAYTLKFNLSENAAIHFKGDGVSQGHRGGKNECVKVTICNVTKHFDVLFNENMLFR